MAATTISAILERVQAVCEAAPVSLEVSSDPFSDMATPNTMTDRTFRIMHGGLVNSRPTSNYQAVRIDRVIVTIQRALNFEGYDALQELQDQLDVIERAVIADGPEHGYMAFVEKGSRKVTRKKDTDVCEASIHFHVDYDFDESN